MKNAHTLTIKRPDDWHLHLRDGEMLKAVLPFSAELYGRAVVMPNLNPPLRTIRDIEAYRRRIMNALPPDHGFMPLMTLYLTDQTPVSELREGKKAGLISAVKLYPVGATTNAEHGVTDLHKVYPVFEAMQAMNIPLSIHGEISDPDVDIFDREAVFIERVLDPLRRDFPELKMILEHVTSKTGVAYVQAAEKKLAATITPHHLRLERNHIFSKGINPHMYCLPIAKRADDRRAVRTAAVSGDRRFFFGSDSAPHLVVDKEKSGGAAGIFNSPTAIAHAARIFEEERALQHFETFVALNGAAFYELAPNKDTITLKKSNEALKPLETIAAGAGRVKVFQTGDPIYWYVARGLRPASVADGEQHECCCSQSADNQRFFGYYKQDE